MVWTFGPPSWFRVRCAEGPGATLRGLVGVEGRTIVNVSWVRPGVLTLLVVQGVGGLAVGILTVVIGESITPGFIPWAFAAGPLLFGAATLVVAFLYWRRHPTARLLAMVVQVVVAASAITALASDSPATLWIPLVMGVVGAVMVVIDSPRQDREGPFGQSLPPDGS